MTQYLLLTGETRFFKSFALRNGRFLTPQETQKGDAFLSTMETGEPQQAGLLNSFGSSPLVEIRPLQQANEYLPMPGKYFVEAPSQEAYRSFVNQFDSLINSHFEEEILRPYPSQSFLQQSGDSGSNNALSGAPPGFGTLGGEFFNYVQEILILIVTITLLLLVYYSFHAAKRIGIMKMHGVSNVRIWYLVVGRLVLLSFLLSSAACLVAAWRIPNTNGSFVAHLMRIQCEAYAAILISSLLVYLYIATMRIADAIKNRKHTRSIFAVNTLVKAGWTVFLVLVILGIWSQYGALQSQQALLKDWQQTEKPRTTASFIPSLRDMP